MSSEIEEIKSRLDIVDVLSSYIKLEKAGINYRACCPFHKEKTPSFFVSPSRQMWHCFGGCNEGGDIFKFVMKIENIEFKEALRILANKAGVQLKTVDVEKEKKEKSEKEICLNICELSAMFFEHCLKNSPTGAKALEYLKGRGLADPTIEEWRLGYSLNHWSKLSEFLIGKGFKKEDIVKAGMAIEKEGNKFFDRFRSRITFPICDIGGRVVGFTGRIFGKDDDMAKYLNTPNTVLYDKSRIIFGLDKAKEAIKEKGFCILVEGNMDCIMSHQAGFKNCVAVSGTALTEYHLGILKRYTHKLVLSFDMDFAGNSATRKAIKQAQLLDFEILVVPSFGEKDPADIILHEGATKWEEIVSSSKPINEFYYDSSLVGRNPHDVNDKKLIASDFLPIIKQMPSNIEQAHWISKLSEILDVDSRDILKELDNIKIDDEGNTRSIKEERLPSLGKKSRGELVDEEIAILVLVDPGKIDLIGESLLHSFTSPIKDLLLKLKGKRDIRIDEIVNTFESDRDHFNYISYLMMKSEMRKDKGSDIDSELPTCLKEKEIILVKNEQKRLSKEIKELEKKGDFEQIKVLLEEFNKLSQNKND
jgi:DNA primase